MPVYSPVPLAGTQVMATSTSSGSQHLLMRTDVLTALTAPLPGLTLAHTTINEIHTEFSILLNLPAHASRKGVPRYRLCSLLRARSVSPPTRYRTQRRMNHANCRRLIARLIVAYYWTDAYCCCRSIVASDTIDGRMWPRRPTHSGNCGDCGLTLGANEPNGGG